MKHILLSLFCALAAITMTANDVTYDFSTSIPSGWKSSGTLQGYETTDPARGAQYVSDASLTLSGVNNATKVVVTYSTNLGDSNYMEVKVGGKSWGKQVLTKDNNITKTFSGTAASGDLVISITRGGKSIFIKKIVVTCDNEGGSTGGETSNLDPDFSYSEPTTVTPSGQTCNNISYSFIQNNIEVKATTGAQAEDYFGCNASAAITFTAANPIKGIVINGYVKQNFEATASTGTITYVNAEDDAVTADPVLVITDIDAKSVTISCAKQLRCYAVEFYFDENPEAEIENSGSSSEEGDYTYDYEPTTATNLDITFKSMTIADYSSYLGYNYTDMYFESDDFDMELGFFAEANATTGVAPGTYEITDTYEEGTIQASPGGDDEYDYPSMIITDFDEDHEYYDTTYYLVGGTVTISQTLTGVKVVVDATTFYGSTVKATYSGVVSIYDGIESVSNNVADKKDGKFLQDGRIVIRRNGKTYMVNGLRLK